VPTDVHRVEVAKAGARGGWVRCFRLSGAVRVALIASGHEWLALHADALCLPGQAGQGRQGAGRQARAGLYCTQGLCVFAREAWQAAGPAAAHHAQLLRALPRLQQAPHGLLLQPARLRLGHLSACLRRGGEGA